jgi:hypothetical protein
LADVKISAATLQNVADLLADTKFPVAQTGQTAAYAVELAELFKLFVSWLDYIGTNPLDGASPLEILLQAGAATAASGLPGAQILLRGGKGDGGSGGGAATLEAADGGATGAGGSVAMVGGAGGSTSGNGGQVAIISGGSTVGDSGVTRLLSGDAASGDSGAVRIQTGAASGTRGDVVIDGGSVQFGATQFAANAAVATVLGSVGPVGSHTTVQEWFAVKNSGGTVRYIPAF